MYKVEAEKIDGTVVFFGADGGRVFARDELGEAEEVAEYFWRRYSGGEVYAVIRVIDLKDDSIYSELECD